MIPTAHYLLPTACFLLQAVEEAMLAMLRDVGDPRAIDPKVVSKTAAELDVEQINVEVLPSKCSHVSKCSHMSKCTTVVKTTVLLYYYATVLLYTTVLLYYCSVSRE